jgi:hypothetical protein
MSRRLIAAFVLAGGAAHADPVDSPPVADDVGDQAIGADIGAAGGGRDTAGGARVAGHYLYQLSDTDWFDGTASFTFGGGSAACFRDRMNAFVCEHGIADGRSVEITAAVRRYFNAQGDFRPFARVGVGVGIANFGDDSVTGLAIPVHVGGGVRATVAENVAIVGQADLAFGFGVFNKSLGLEPQLGLAVTAGAEFKLQ